MSQETGVSLRLRQILGIRFFDGGVERSDRVHVSQGGFLVAPSGTCFGRLRDDEPYRRAILAADLAIADFSLGDSCFKI